MAFILGENSGGSYTVSDYVDEPELIVDEIVSIVQDAAIENVFYSDDGETTASAIIFKQRVSPFLSESPHEVAEFEEIPTADIRVGDDKVEKAFKIAEGLRVSYEMIKDNRIDLLSRGVEQLANEFLYASARQGLDRVKAATDEHNQVVSAGTPWSTVTAEIGQDVLRACAIVSSALVDGDVDDERKAALGYTPDTLVMHPSVWYNIIGNKTIQAAFIGANSGDNPYFKGFQPYKPWGLDVAVSQYVDPKQVYVLQAKKPGGKKFLDRPQVTPLYSPHGDSGIGGATMEYRADIMERSIRALYDPKAVARIQVG